MAVGTTDGLAVDVETVDDVVGCEHTASANVIATASSAAAQRILQS